MRVRLNAVWVALWVKTLVAIVSTMTCVFAQTTTPSTNPVIDVHWHATMEPGDVTTPQAKTARRDAMAALDALHVQYIVVTGVPDALAAWREEFPDRVIPSLLFPCEKGLAPNFGRPCFPNGTEFPEIAWLREEIKAGRIKALGEITAQYLGIAPNDVRLEPYFALAEEFDIPVTIHLGLGPPAAAYPSNPAPVKSPNYRASAGRPLLLEEVLLRHKQLRVSMMHAGWPLIDETIFMLRQHPGLYADVAVLQSTIPRSAYYEALRKLVDAGYADRIMVGSDGGVNALREGIEAILKAPFLSDTQKNDILHNNAARFFRLKTAKP